MTGKQLGQQMLEAVKAFVGRSLSGISKRQDELETLIKSIPSGERGLKGDEGKSAYQIAVEKGFKGSESEWLESLKGIKGESGEKGEPGDQGENGEDGLDALEIEILPSIDESKRYPRASYASHKGGLWRAYKNTDGMDGWECIVNGITDVSIVQNSEREFSVKFVMACGKESETKFNLPVLLYKGVWKEGDFLKGDVVTWGGSSWHCENPTKEKPGTCPDWKLMVKEGRPGKDGKNGDRGPEGKAGRDYR